MSKNLRLQGQGGGSCASAIHSLQEPVLDRPVGEWLKEFIEGLHIGLSVLIPSQCSQIVVAPIFTSQSQDNDGLPGNSVRIGTMAPKTMGSKSKKAIRRCSSCVSFCPILDLCTVMSFFEQEKTETPRRIKAAISGL